MAAPLKREYFMRSLDPGTNKVRIIPELRRQGKFCRLKFMGIDYGINERADAIFCRGAIIHFDCLTQERILGKLARHLMPCGFMFVGHAETLHGMNLPLAPVTPTSVSLPSDRHVFSAGFRVECS